MPSFEWLKRLAGALHPGRIDDSLSLLAIAPLDRDRRTLRKVAEQAGWKLTLTGSCEEAVALLGQQRFGVILCDRELPEFDWCDAMEILVASAPAACVILTSPVSDDYLWEEVVQRGGYDVLSKPLNEDQVQHVVNSAWLCWKTGWSQLSAKRQNPPRR